MDRQPRTKLDHFAMAILVMFGLAAPLMIHGALNAIEGKANRVIDWLPTSYSETNDLAWYIQHFPGDQFVVVSWDGCRLGGDRSKPDSAVDDPRIEKLAAAVLDERYQQSFQSVVTARRLLNQMTTGSMSMPYDTAVSRLSGSLIGPDGQQTCVVVMLSDQAIHDLRAVVGRPSSGWLEFSREEGLLFTVLRDCGIQSDEAHLGGPPVDGVAIDEEGERTLYRLAALATIVGALLAWWSLRSIILTWIVFICGLMSAVTSLAVVWLTGETTDAFLLSMPSLVYVLAISGAVHLIKYYRDALDRFGPRHAPIQAIVDGWKPTLLCSVTTSFGLLSLCTSDLTPVRKFGIYSSLGVMLMLVTLFLFLPAALYVLAGRSHRKNQLPTYSLDRFWEWFGSGVIRHYKAITAFCLLLIIVMGIGVTRVRSTVDLMKLFDRDATILQDYRWLETNVARLVPLEIVLRFDAESLQREDDATSDSPRYSLLERVEIVTGVQRTIDARFGPRGEDLTGRSMSACTFISSLPKRGRDLRTTARRTVADTKLNRDYDELRQSGYLAVDPVDGAELWRISIRVAAFKNVDYGELSTRIRDLVDPIVVRLNELQVGSIGNESTATEQATEQATESAAPLSAVYTGVVPIIYKAQRALLDSLIQSTFWSFITITPLLMIVSRGFWAGATAMLPNALPVLAVFGGMGWLGVPVAIGSMMSAGIALGVAVDDTIHFLMWFRRDLDETSDRAKSSLAAYRRCASPTLQAAMISGFGLSVFALSTFTPTKQFGLLMLTILLAGVVAELILLPALLAGPLGRAFQPRKK